MWAGFLDPTAHSFFISSRCLFVSSADTDTFSEFFGPTALKHAFFDLPSCGF